MWQLAGALALLLAISALVAMARRRRYLVMGWLWFLITLVPMNGIVQVGHQAMADRYAYVSFVGLFIMVCWSVADFGTRSWQWGASSAFDDRAESRPVPIPWRAALSVVVVLVLVVLTHRQIGYWKDALTLWRHAANVVPGNWLAEDNVGLLLQQAGRPEQEVVPHFFKASAANPADSLSNMYIAIYEQTHGHPQEAVLRYDNVLRNPLPLRAEAPIDQNMGAAYLELGDRAKAQQCFD